MPEKINLDFIKNNTALLNQIYDVVRVVDPMEKKTIDLNQSGLIVADGTCYGYWNKGRVCENCISARALNEDKSFFKLEQRNDAVMMVTVFPIQDKGNSLVIELLKNVTDSMIIGSNDISGNNLVSDILLNINDLVVKDQLTSLYNRRFVNERLPADIVQDRLNLFPLSLLFIDLDNLKIINDNYGHQAGDLAIKAVSSTILECIRSEKDWAARYGGDEFIVCLNNTGSDDAYLVAERIRTRIEKMRILEGKINITVSIGIHTVRIGKETAEEIISMADQKMYEAKKHGKNFTMRVAG